MKRYFISDSKKGLLHIKKIILSKVIAILRPHDDIITLLGKKYFSRISPLEIHLFSYIILSNCFCVWYNLLCEEQFVSGMWYDLLCEEQFVSGMWYNLLCEEQFVSGMWYDLLCEEQFVSGMWYNLLCEEQLVSGMSYNLLCEEQFVSVMWYADDSFIISFLNILFFILA